MSSPRRCAGCFWVFRPPRAAAHAEHYQLLNTAQEEALLSYIDKMTARNIPSIVQIIHNLATELLERAPDVN
jgi:hypothetical protein